MSEGFDATDDAPARLALYAPRFIVAVVIVAAAVFCIGWFTNLQQVAYGAMISSIAFVMLPFLIIAMGLVLCFVEIGEPVVLGGIYSIKPHYRWLARQNHPLF